MKRLQKIALASSEAYFKSRPASLLSIEELRNVYAGSGPNECYFDTMAWVSNYYGGQTGDSHDTSYYFDSYYAQYGASGIDYDSSGNMLGAYSTDLSGFALEYFYGSELAASQVADFISNLSTGHNVLMTAEYVYDANGSIVTDANGTPLTHEIVITGEDQNGNLTGYDPTNQQQVNNLGLGNLVPGTQEGITGMINQY